MEERIKKVQRRYDEAVKVRSDYEPLWKDVTDLLAIRRSDIDQTETPGKKKGLSIYDGTPKAACQQQADGYYGYLCSPSMEWFRLKMVKGPLNDVHEIKQYLQGCEEQLYYAFNRSNFYEQVPLYFFDGCSIGTATMYAEEDIGHGRIVFMVRAPGEIYISENRYGEVDMIFRKYKMTVRNAIAQFGKENLSESLVRAAENSPEARHTFIHCVYPNDDVQLGKVDARNKAFVSVYFEEKSDKFARESGYDQFPFFVWRYRVDSGEVYGRSPASDAIIEIFGLNQVSKTLLQAGQLAVEPAWNVPEEMKGKTRIKPRGENYYRDKDRTITPLHNIANYNFGQYNQERLEKAIEKHFHTEFFMLLSRAAMEGRQLTVPQVMEMQGEKGALLGAVVGRLNGDFFDNVIDRVFNIETLAGRMPDVPDIIYEMGETDIDVEYLGPLAQAQKQQVKTQGILKGLQMITPFFEVYPEMRDRIDPDVTVDEILESVNFPQNAIIRKEDAVKARAARAQLIQQQQQMEMMAAAADRVPALSKAPEEGSIAGRMMEG